MSKSEISEFLVEDTCDNLYHFNYDANTRDDEYITAEDLFDHCAAFLRKREFIREARAELAIVAFDSKGRWNLMNNVSDWGVDELMAHASELGKLGNLKRKCINRICIYNLYLPFDTALVLEAYATPLERKYLLLDVFRANFNTQELGELIELMIYYRLIRIGDHSDLRWLRQKYLAD